MITPLYIAVCLSVWEKCVEINSYLWNCLRVTKDQDMDVDDLMVDPEDLDIKKGPPTGIPKNKRPPTAMRPRKEF